MCHRVSFDYHSCVYSTVLTQLYFHLLIMLRKLVTSTFIALSITAPVQAQPASHGKATPASVQQPLPDYSVQKPEIPKHIGIPNSVFPGVGEPGIATPVGLPSIEVQKVGVPLKQLQLSAQDEALRTHSAFDAALDQTQLLKIKTRYPTTYNGVPQDIQKIIDQGTVLSGEAASR